MKTRQNHFMVLVTLVALVALILAAAQNADSKFILDLAPEPPTSQQLRLGPLLIEVNMNVTRYVDRLRVSKRSIKIVTRNALMPNSPPLAIYKAGLLVELIRCDNLTLARPSAELLIDCRNLESYIDSDAVQVPTASSSSSSSRNNLYALRVTLKLKPSYLLDASVRGPRRQLMLYLLRQDMAARELGELLVGDAASFISEGFYVEAKESRSDSVCHALFFWAQNMTSPKDDFWGSLMEGGAAKISDFSCGSPTSPIRMEMQFEMLFKQQFPYLSLNHSFIFAPLPLWTYVGRIEQTREPGADLSDARPEVYKTHVSMDSKSSLFNMFNFELNQTFANQPGGSGWELMHLVHPDFLAVVSSEWTLESLVKRLLLLVPAGQGDLADFGKPFAELEYRDEPEESRDVVLSLKLDRKFLSPFFPFFSPAARTDTSADASADASDQEQFASSSQQRTEL